MFHIVRRAQDIVLGRVRGDFRVHDFICLKDVIDDLVAGFFLEEADHIRIQIFSPVIDIEQIAVVVGNIFPLLNGDAAAGEGGNDERGRR